MLNLKAIAEYLQVDATAFAAAYNDAPHAAQRPNGNWPSSGCGTEEERAVIYAIAYVLKPALILDLGTSYGASATMLSDAVMKRGAGAVWTVDNRDRLEDGRVRIGAMIPENNNRVIVQHISDAAGFLDKFVTAAPDLIVEDTAHDKQTTANIWRAALEKAKPGTVIMSHDANHVGYGPGVVAGVEAAGVTDYYIMDTPMGYLIHRVAETKAKPKASSASAPLSTTAAEPPRTRKRSTRKRTTKKDAVT